MVVLTYVWALLLVALMLVALTYAVRFIGRGRLVSAAGKRLVTVVESTFLAQNTTLHVVKVADRYFLIGGGSSGVHQVAELTAEQIEPYIEAQRKALSDQRDAALRFLQRFRK